MGKGSFGKAFLVICGSDGVSQKNFLESYKLIMFLSCCMQSHAVVKKIDIKKMSEDDKQSTFREAKILEVLNHPNIIRFKEVYKTKQGQLCIVMDYADGKLKELNLIALCYSQKSFNKFRRRHGSKDSGSAN